MLQGKEFWQSFRVSETQKRQSDFVDFKSDTYKDLEIQTWTTNDGKMRLVIYKGKSGKPISNFILKTVEQKNAEIDYQKRNADKRFAWKERAKEIQKNTKNIFQLGDILASSWGYDQTNIDFYEVVGITAKSIKIIKIGQSRTDENTGHYLSEYVVPDRKARGTNVMTKRIQPGTDSPFISINSFAIARKWNGTPLFQSHWH